MQSTPYGRLLIIDPGCSLESAERTSTQVTYRANRKKCLTVPYIVEHPNQEGDTCIDWTSQYCWTNGWNCLWRGHSVYRNRPLIPPPRRTSTHIAHMCHPTYPSLDANPRCDISVSPLQGSLPHALSVLPVGGMYCTPSAVMSSANSAAGTASNVFTACTVSDGYSTDASCEPGVIPFITTPGPYLKDLGLIQLASGYVPSTGKHQVAHCFCFFPDFPPVPGVFRCFLVFFDCFCACAIFSGIC